MADEKRKSQAEKAAAKKTHRPNKENTQKQKETNTNKQKDSKAKPDKSSIPARYISALVFLALFITLLFAFIWPDGGIVLTVFYNLIHSLVGSIGYIVLIPILLYLFFIHAFSGPRPIRMRTVCLFSFVLLCGAFDHIMQNTEWLPGGFSFLVELVSSGIEGTTGGLICGTIGWIVDKLLGPLAGLALIISAILTFMGGMQITVPSIIRAIQNRPRAQWEEEDKQAEEKQEPAAIVVNHIANKRIEYIERRRNLSLDDTDDEDEEEMPLPLPPRDEESSDRVNSIISQIDSDVEDPVAAASNSNVEMDDVELITSKFTANKKQQEAPTGSMPPLERNLTDAEDAPKENVKVAVVVKKEKVTAKDAEKSAAVVAKEIAEEQKRERPAYCFPPMDLLKLPGRDVADGTAEMRENSRRLNETLASFKIEAHIINVTRGPSVTRYEVELEKGVRLSKLTTAADDIALSLGATGVRIAAVPGKISVVGIEVPNRAVTTVSLREVIDSSEFAKAKSKSSFAVGKDIGGNCIVGNIARLPHMLIAGTTGSGKSVCMNSIIISLLYKASPDDVKLIMVDPKMVELGIYNGIPHLLIPVVTDPKKAAGSLQWAVSEMMRRYKAMSDAGVRDLESYNSIIESQEVEGSKLPQVVVIIDELADLMLVAAKEVEESICRIAQMGRAAGIHLVIATQRPSADVITGLMKANIPSRIAFAVASAMESRIILDTQGAEKLVGKGDMLYAPIGNGKPKRVQGCFVSDPEVEAVASYVKSNYTTNYDQDVMEEIEKKAAQAGNKTPTAAEPMPNDDELSGDEMLPAAVDVILETGQASVSMLQRRLKLGYARAARIVDEMEEKGIVGPFVGSKPRAILVTKEQWMAMRSGASSQMGFSDLETEGDLGAEEE